MKKLTAAVILALFAGFIVLTPGTAGPEAAGQASGHTDFGNDGQTVSERLWPPTGRELSVALRVNHQPGQVPAKDLNDVVVISRPGRAIEIWDFLGVSSAPQSVGKQQASPRVVSLTSSMEKLR